MNRDNVSSLMCTDRQLRCEMLPNGKRGRLGERLPNGGRGGRGERIRHDTRPPLPKAIFFKPETEVLELGIGEWLPC